MKGAPHLLGYMLFGLKILIGVMIFGALCFWRVASHYRRKAYGPGSGRR